MNEPGLPNSDQPHGEPDIMCRVGDKYVSVECKLTGEHVIPAWVDPDTEKQVRRLLELRSLTSQPLRIIRGSKVIFGMISHRQKPVRIARPPRLWLSWIGRMVMSPAGYRRWCEPHIADMHEEFFDCLKRGDKWGARRAVIRANLYAVPAWVWGIAAHLLHRVVEWIRA